MSMSLDLVGGSSHFWHWKHVVFHHTFVNVVGYDTDINLAGLGRLTPHHPRACGSSLAALVRLALVRPHGDEVASLR